MKKNIGDYLNEFRENNPNLPLYFSVASLCISALFVILKFAFF